jgi:hypothetical protein
VDKTNTKPAETEAQQRDDTNSLRLVINNLVLKKMGRQEVPKINRVQRSANPQGPRRRQIVEVVSQLPRTKAVPSVVLSRKTTSRVLDRDGFVNRVNLTCVTGDFWVETTRSALPSYLSKETV